MASNVSQIGTDSLESRMIKRHLVTLTKNIDCSDTLLNHFRQTETLTSEALEAVSAKTTNVGKNTLLLEKIMMRGPEAFYVLYKALVDMGRDDLTNLIMPSRALSRPVGFRPVQEVIGKSQVGFGRSQPPDEVDSPSNSILNRQLKVGSCNHQDNKVLLTLLPLLVKLLLIIQLMLLYLEWITSKKYFESYGELYKKLPTDRSEANSLAFEKKASKCAHPNRTPMNCENLSSRDDLTRIFTCDNPQRCHVVESSKQVKSALVENSTNDEKADFFSECTTDTVDRWVPVKRKKPFRVQPKDAAFSKRTAFSKGTAFKKMNNVPATCSFKQHKDHLLTNPMSEWVSQKTSSKNKWHAKRRKKNHEQKRTRRRRRRRSKRAHTAPMVRFKPPFSSKVDFVAQPLTKPPSYPKTGNEAYVDGTSGESKWSMTKETRASASKQSTAKPVALQTRPKVYKCTRWPLKKSSPSIKNVRSKMRVNEPAGHFRRVYKGIMVKYSFDRNTTNCKFPKKRGITRKPINKVFLKLTMIRIPFCTKRSFAFYHKEFDHLTINGVEVITPSTTISGSRVFAVEGLMIQRASFRVLKGPFFEFEVDWSSEVKVLEKDFLEHNPSRIKICRTPNISWAVGILRVYWLNSMRVIDLRNIPVEGETSVIDHEMKTFIWDPGGSAAFRVKALFGI